MLRILLLAAAIVPVMALGASPAFAFGDAPWCTVSIEGPGIHYECVYNSVAACRSHVVSGNRGTCSENPFTRARPSALSRPAAGATAINRV